MIASEFVWLLLYSFEKSASDVYFSRNLKDILEINIAENAHVEREG